MDVTIRSGTVASDSVLPRLVDLKPGLIDPLKFRVEDNFTQVRAALAASSPDFANAAQLWVTSGALGMFPTTDGGYVTSASATATLDLGAAPVKLMARIKWGIASSYAGLLARYADGNNYIRASLSQSLGVLLEKRVAGATTTILSVPKAFVVGQTYLLTLKIVGDLMTVYCDHVVAGSATDTANSANTKGGIMAGNAAHAIKYFGAGGV